MRASSPTSTATLWASAYLGCALWLASTLLPPSSASIALAGELGWLALIGSIPSALVLGAAVRAARASNSVLALSSVAVCILVVAIGWDHAEFLLSGPKWVLHPQHLAIRAGLLATMGVLGVIGWLWLVLGVRSEDKPPLAAWLVLSAIVVGTLSVGIVRYRAYDYSMAQLVFPAGILCGAMVRPLGDRSALRRFALGASTVGVLFGVATRFDPDLAATGRRELMAHSRVGALATLYVLPHVAREGVWSASGPACPQLRPFVEQSPIGVEPEGRRNVIIVTVDAFRSDVVGVEVDGHPVTPELSRLSKTGVSYPHATSPYPATLFAMGSAFTGLTPAELYLSPVLPDTIFTRSRGRVDQQLAILPDVRWFRLPIVGRFLTPGVQTRFAPTDVAATTALIERLRAARDEGQSIMAWVHYYSPHDPYEVHSTLRFGEGKKNAYLSDVAYFDQELGRLMRFLTDDGWLDDTLVIFFSDHGEALGEQSYWGHHVYLDSWMVDVPLVLWHARLAPAEPQVGVSLTDVAPTVLHFLGLPIPADIAAQSLFTLDPNASNRPTFSEAFPVRGRELFDSFALVALDDDSIRDRLQSIRVANEGYEPKGSIRSGSERLIHHRGADTTLFYAESSDSDGGSSRPVSGDDDRERLRSQLERWEEEQLRRIQCRLQLSAGRSATPRPE